MLKRRGELENGPGQKYDGFLGQRKGSRVLPDIRTAILARMRGYIGGFYPSPLTGEAAEMGYYPLSSATPDEMIKIEEEARRLSG